MREIKLKKKSVSLVKANKIDLRKDKTSRIKYRQKILLRYLVAGCDLAMACEKIGISEIRGKSWMRKDYMKDELDRLLKERLDIDINKRKKRMEFLSSEIYDALIEKIASGSLENMNPKSLFKMLNETNKEMRLDDVDHPSNKNKNDGGKTNISIHIHEELASRYMKSSFKSDTDQKKLMGMIEPPEVIVEQTDEDLKKEKDDVDIKEGSGVHLQRVK